MDLIKLSRISDSENDDERMKSLLNKENIIGHANAMAKSIKGVPKLLERLKGLEAAISESNDPFVAYLVREIIQAFSEKILKEGSEEQITEFREIESTLISKANDRHKELDRLFREASKAREEEKNRDIEQFLSKSNRGVIANKLKDFLESNYDASQVQISNGKLTVVSTNDKEGDLFKISLTPDGNKGLIEYKIVISRPRWWRSSVRAGFGEGKLISSVDYSNDYLVKSIDG